MDVNEYSRNELYRLDRQVISLTRRVKSLNRIATMQRHKILELEDELIKALDSPAVNIELELENKMLRARLDHAVQELAVPKSKRPTLTKEEWLYLLRQV